MQNRFHHTWLSSLMPIWPPVYCSCGRDRKSPSAVNRQMWLSCNYHWRGTWSAYTPLALQHYCHTFKDEARVQTAWSLQCNLVYFVSCYLVTDVRPNSSDHVFFIRVFFFFFHTVYCSGQLYSLSKHQIGFCSCVTGICPYWNVNMWL